MNMDKKLMILLIGIILISGCIGQEERPPEKPSDKDNAILACEQECNAKLNENIDLSKGPCLLNPIQDVPDWICDVAHNPRQTLDNQPENQCSVFRDGKAHHFVEVDVNCELIQVV